MYNTSCSSAGRSNVKSTGFNLDPEAQKKEGTVCVCVLLLKCPFPPSVLQTGGLQVRGVRGLRLPRLCLHLLHPDRHRAAVSLGWLKYALVSHSSFPH